MKRKFLVAAVAVGPLLIAAAPAWAQLSISTSTSTPVATATANNGSPEDIDIVSGGSIGVTASGTAVTLNSNNNVSNGGAIGFTGINNAVGVLIEGGYTGQFTNTGTITLTETYTAPTDPNNDGLYTGAFAEGTDRTALEVTGPGTFNGGILDTGVISVVGNNSQGILIQAPITGNLMMLQVTAATSTAAATISAGSITVTGANTVGLEVTPTGGIGGNVRILGVSATGPGAQAVVLNGPIGGFVDISAGITTTGYRTTSRSANPTLSINYSPEELQQGGASLTLGGSIGGGLIISAPPPVLSTTVPDLDGDGVPDDLQGTGVVSSYGSSPAVQIGAVGAGGGAAPAITIGPYETGTGAGTGATNFLGYSFINQGTILANSLFDPLTSPLLNGQVLPATAVQIGGQILIPAQYSTTGNVTTLVTPAYYLPSGAVTLTGGFYNSGSISAEAYQANATAIHIGAGATAPVIANDGQIFALSTQINSATTATNNGSYPVTPAPAPVSVTAIQIDAGASVTTINNNSGIIAELTGTAGPGGAATAIIDKSGTLQNINNTGSILAELNQTLVSALMPGTTVAIDMSQSTLPQTITQSVSSYAATSTAYVATSAYVIGNVVNYNGNIYQNVVAAGAGYDPLDYPAYWREIGALSPSITGDILFGSGPDTLNVQGGTVVSTNIAMGGALNTITINNGASVVGSITETGAGAFAINLVNGYLSDSNPNKVNATSVNVGASGVLLVSADPQNANGSRNTEFLTSGASTIASGAQFGLTLLSVQTALVQNYIVIQTTGAGTITTGTLGPTSLGNTPFLYSATSSYVAPTVSDPNSEIELTVTRKTPTQLGFNAAEASAYNAILAALPADLGIQQALLSPTTDAGLKAAYDQLLPNQGQGLFEAIDAAAEKISGFTGTTPDNGQRVGGSSLWLQEVNERVDRSGVESVGTDAKLLGIVGGYERMGKAGGALGVTLGYFNASEQDVSASVGANELASLVEAGLYYRRAAGPFGFSVRGAGGYSWFSENRIFASSSVINKAQAAWGGEFVDGHIGLSYEVHLGRYYARPELSADYTRLHQNGYSEYGGGSGFDLVVSPQTDTQFTGQAVMVVGSQWGKAAWLRSEMRFGYREVFEGEVGDTTAAFADGSPFTLAGDPDRGGWVTVGFSLKTGTEFSYFALEGDADFRYGEQRYDLRVAGRSMF